MATELKRKVRRSFKTGWGKVLSITLDPDGYIRLKEKYSRRVYSTSIESLYYLLVRATGIKKRITRRTGKNV